MTSVLPGLVLLPASPQYLAVLRPHTWSLTAAWAGVRGAVWRILGQAQEPRPAHVGMAGGPVGNSPELAGLAHHPLGVTAALS